MEIFICKLTVLKNFSAVVSLSRAVVRSLKKFYLLNWILFLMDVQKWCQEPLFNFFQSFIVHKITSWFFLIKFFKTISNFYIIFFTILTFYTILNFKRLSLQFLIFNRTPISRHIIWHRPHHVIVIVAIDVDSSIAIEFLLIKSKFLMTSFRF